jgi:hypothetical protein
VGAIGFSCFISAFQHSGQLVVFSKAVIDDHPVLSMVEIDMRVISSSRFESSAYIMKVLFSETAFGTYYIETCPEPLRAPVRAVADWLQRQTISNTAAGTLLPFVGDARISHNFSRPLTSPSTREFGNKADVFDPTRRCAKAAGD